MLGPHKGPDVGTDLSSRSVSRQVFSALVSLTSVFGMGTGGPSPLKAPTILFSARLLRVQEPRLVTRGRVELPFGA